MNEVKKIAFPIIHVNLYGSKIPCGQQFKTFEMLICHNSIFIARKKILMQELYIYIHM